MRALRVVGLTEDGEVVLEDPVGASATRCRPTSAARCRAGRSLPSRTDRDRVGEPVATTRDPGPHSRGSVRGAGGHGGRGAGAEDRTVCLPGADRTLPDRGATPNAPTRCAPTARTTAPSARSSRTRSGCAARPTRGAKWDSWKGEDGTLGGRPELARGAFGQPGALGVPARGARRHGHRAGRARERPGRGTAGTAAADGRCGGRHRPGRRRSRRPRRRRWSSGARPRPTATASACRSAPTRHGPRAAPRRSRGALRRPRSGRPRPRSNVRARTGRRNRPPIPVPRHDPTPTGRPSLSPTPSSGPPVGHRPAAHGGAARRPDDGGVGSLGARREPVGGVDRTRAADHLSTRRPGHRARGTDRRADALL